MKVAKIDIKDFSQIPLLCGKKDENLKLIERELGVEFALRDNSLKIKGKDESVEKAKELIRELMEFNILDYTRSDALLSAKLEVELEKIGKPAGRFDTMIAAVCINRDALLLTLNRTHFERFTKFGLRLFNV